MFHIDEVSMVLFGFKLEIVFVVKEKIYFCGLM